MKRYRLVVREGDKLLGHFDADAPWAAEAVQDIARHLAHAGYALELLVASEERRLLESGPDGLRVLASEALYTPVRPET